MGLSPTATLQFLAPPASVTIAVGQGIYVVSHKGLGSTAVGGANALDLRMCYQLGAGPLTFIGGGIYGLQVPQNTRQIFGLSAVINGLAAGTYNVGLCGSSTSLNWNNNEYGDTSAMIIKP